MSINFPRHRTTTTSIIFLTFYLKELKLNIDVKSEDNRKKYRQKTTNQRYNIEQQPLFTIFLTFSFLIGRGGVSSSEFQIELAELNGTRGSFLWNYF